MTWLSHCWTDGPNSAVIPLSSHSAPKQVPITAGKPARGPPSGWSSLEKSGPILVLAGPALLQNPM